jgi:hypothetical protein
MPASRDRQALKDVGARCIAVGALVLLLWQAYEYRSLPTLLTVPLWWSYLFVRLLHQQWTRRAEIDAGVPQSPGDLTVLVERLRSWWGARVH